MTALERADEGLISLTAKVEYDKTFELQGDRQLRKGKLYFVNKEEGKPGERRFAIVFNELWIGDVVRKEEQIFVFDGQWLVEKDPAHKEFHKRQIVPPGEHFDPLRIGEGPLPIPIGQKRADIEQRFDATLLPAADGLVATADADAAEKSEVENRKEHVADGWQIKLIPKPAFERESDFKEVRLWYKREKGDLLPVMARTVNRDGDMSVVKLSDVQVQKQGVAKNAAAEVPQDVIDTRPPKEGWNIDIQEFRRPKGD
jgi:hypothetical protein